MESSEFYSKCKNDVLFNLLQCWRDFLTGEQIRTIKDILEERGEKLPDDC
jgi:hypothetical protein